MPECKYHTICGRDVEDNSAEGLCILHSTDPAKDTHAFTRALAAHRARNRDNFVNFVFPGKADFSNVTFTNEANFHEARFSERASFFRATFSQGAVFDEVTFTKGANFSGATFIKQAGFNGVMFSEGANFSATFNKEADFGGATFLEWAGFDGATFREQAYFGGCTFTKEVFFDGATFMKGVDFRGATFIKETDFSGATFTERASFRGATFSGKTLFAGTLQDISGEALETNYIFAGTEVDFRQVVINPLDAITFLGADLTKCQFLDTDLRKVQLVDVTWPRKGRGTIVYDEMALVKSAEGSARPWPQIERLYRELKQNYEDRRDYERAGDFHYGEKEMRRQNPETARGLRFFLTLYWLFSGYGERYLRPLLWAGLLFVGSTIGYMWWGLRLKDGSSSLAWTYPWINPRDWLQAAYYSFRVMTLLKPDDWVPLQYAQLVNTFQTLLGPTFLGLFALALRQRLKR